jgi:hypothetical protein
LDLYRSLLGILEQCSVRRQHLFGGRLSVAIFLLWGTPDRTLEIPRSANLPGSTRGRMFRFGIGFGGVGESLSLNRKWQFKLCGLVDA